MTCLVPARDHKRRVMSPHSDAIDFVDQVPRSGHRLDEQTNQAFSNPASR
jgi:hypothetical protein